MPKPPSLNPKPQTYTKPCTPNPSPTPKPRLLPTRGWYYGAVFSLLKRAAARMLWTGRPGWQLMGAGSNFGGMFPPSFFLGDPGWSFTLQTSQETRLLCRIECSQAHVVTSVQRVGWHAWCPLKHLLTNPVAIIVLAWRNPVGHRSLRPAGDAGLFAAEGRA